jgi:DNA modification methylase
MLTIWKNEGDIKKIQCLMAITQTISRIQNLKQGSLHPTQKPVGIIRMLVKTYTNEGDMVLDNTMGSGTTNLGLYQIKPQINWNRKGKTILRCRCSEGFGVFH